MGEAEALTLAAIVFVPSEVPALVTLDTGALPLDEAPVLSAPDCVALTPGEDRTPTLGCRGVLLLAVPLLLSLSGVLVEGPPVLDSEQNSVITVVGFLQFVT